jgi:LCP family protein required for cell wall assembly
MAGGAVVSGNGRHRDGRPLKSRASARATLAAKVIAALVSAVLLIGAGYAKHYYGAINSVSRFHLPALGPPTTTPAAGPTGAASGGAVPKVQGKAQNILIVGLDSRAGLSAAEQKLLYVGDDPSVSTDSMMIIHVPADGSKATLISLPRDAYVDIPEGWRKNKLNAAYADAWGETTGTEKQKEAAGANLLIETVKQLTGLSIDHYVQVSFGGFYTITKAIGDLTVNLCHATDDTIAYNEAHGEGDVGSGFVMAAGEHTLTPLQAFRFVRQRHNITGGDLARVERQRYFLTAAFAKIESTGVLLSPTKLNNLINAIKGSFYVDDNDGFNLVTLAEQMSALTANHITGVTIPTEGNSTVSIEGQSSDVELVDPAKVQSYLANLLNGTLPTPTATPTTGASSSTATTAPAGSTSTASSTASAPTAGCIN